MRLDSLLLALQLTSRFSSCDDEGANVDSSMPPPPNPSQAAIDHQVAKRAESSFGHIDKLLTDAYDMATVAHEQGLVELPTAEQAELVAKVERLMSILRPAGATTQQDTTDNLIVSSASTPAPRSTVPILGDVTNVLPVPSSSRQAKRPRNEALLDPEKEKKQVRHQSHSVH